MKYFLFILSLLLIPHSAYAVWIPVNGVCGASNKTVVSSPPKNLCTTGTASTLAGGTISPWTWTCAGTNFGARVSCGADPSSITLTPANAVKGRINVLTMYYCCSQTVTVQGNGMVSAGWWQGSGYNNKTERLNATTVRITDQHANGQAVTLVNVPTLYFSDGVSLNLSTVGTINGTCGAANGATSSTKPAGSNLCALGTASSVNGNGPWTWSCNGSSGGTNANCQANPPVFVNGSCGAANGTSAYTMPATNLCTAGTSSAVSGNGPWAWACAGQYGGKTAQCSASLATVNGVCGASNGTALTSAPQTGLCSAGTADSVTGSGPWSWLCNGFNGGTNATCSASWAKKKGTVIGIGNKNISSAAATEISNICTNHTIAFPASWEWGGPSSITDQPRAATAADNLTPKIVQVRNGKVIATYTSFSSSAHCNSNLQNNATPQEAAATGCGAFSDIAHVDLFRLWENGDTFLVYPAVYTGQENNVFIGPRGDQVTGWSNTFIPENITIRGVTQNGIRPVIANTPPASDWASAQAPVYVFNSSGLVIDNLDVENGTVQNPWGMAGIYVNGAKNLTLTRMRIVDFDLRPANGVFGTANNTGTFTLNQVELARNGGYESSYEHNAYINASASDPNYTVHLINSWSHDAYIGHLFKSRAQVTIAEGNYFEGGTPRKGFPQAEAYLLDVPNGGRLVVRNNIFVKNASGLDSNGMALTFAVEGMNANEAPDRAQSIDIENNTFVALAATYDGSHALFPFFFWNDLIPGTSTFKVPTTATGSGYVVPSTVIAKNLFVGYCPQNYSFMNYRGDVSMTVAFSELYPDFSLTNAYLYGDTSIVGTPAYAHAAQGGLTRTIITDGSQQFTTVGAEDQ